MEAISTTPLTLIQLIMKTYFFCVEDAYGQRTGEYKIVHLDESLIEYNRFGFKTYKGHFLYEDEYQVLLACLD